MALCCVHRQLLSSLLQRDFAGFFSSSAALNAGFSPLAQRLNAALRSEVQMRNLQSIRVAYALISVDAATPLLGVPKDSVGAFLAQHGWQADPQSPANYFTPPAADVKKPRQISQQQIEQLTKYVTHLED